MEKKTIDVEEQNKRKKIIFFLIFILLLLLLLTSCTSSLFGTIGNWFHREGHYTIDPDTNDQEIITNDHLTFDAKDVTMSLQDQKIYLSYTLKNLVSSSITCSTSDASIATCYVESGYVVVLAKKIGNVQIILETIQNGKTYQAISSLHIVGEDPTIQLSKESDEIYLSYTNESFFSYQFSGVIDSFHITSSNESIAKVTVNNGLVSIVAIRSGVVDILVSIESNGVIYTATYHLTIHEKENRGPNLLPGNSNGSKPPVLSGDNTIKELHVSSGTVSFLPNTFTYYVVVGKDTQEISLEAILNHSDASVIYVSDGIQVTSLKNLKLKEGDNRLTLLVTAPNGAVQVYSVVIYKPSYDTTLKDIVVQNGSLSPRFHKDILSYVVQVPSHITSNQITPVLSNPNATLQYKYQGQVVSSLESLKLQSGHNYVEITVSDASETRTYVVDIYRAMSDNAYLSSLEVLGSSFHESFSPSRFEYSTDVSFSAKTLSFVSTLMESSSSLRYEWNGKNVSNLTNLPLQDGENKLKVIVTSESGKENIYCVTVHKPVRTIAWDQETYVVDFDSPSIAVFYSVYEDGKKIKDYSLTDIQLSGLDYQGGYKIYSGYVLFTPSYAMKNKTATFTLNYQGKNDECSVTFTMKDYYISSDLKDYHLLHTTTGGDKTIVLNTNLFLGAVDVQAIAGGIRISSSTNPKKYIDILETSSLLEITSEPGTVGSSVAIKITTKQIGDTVLQITGSAFGSVFEHFELSIHITMNYKIVLDANGGFFDELSNRYQWLVSENDTISLGNYPAYRVDESGNCLYYTLQEFNTKSDGSGQSYSITDVLKNFSKDMTLYAIYKEESQYIELEENKKLYLTDVDLFYNEEYFEAYQKKNMIYPGAQGSYVILLTNNRYDEIRLDGMTLEEDTICIPSLGCLNMGYIIKYAGASDPNYTYYYGSKDRYQILNQDLLTIQNVLHTKRSIPFSKGISLPKGQTIEISLLWEWVNDNDVLDTEIGIGTELDYQLTVSFDFTTTNRFCKKN